MGATMMSRNILAALAIVVFSLFAASADAATCFWVGGSGTYSTTNGVNWSNASGGSASTCAATGGVPKNAGDIAVVDTGSAASVITVDATMSGATIATFQDTGGFTGTIDFSAVSGMTFSTQFNSNSTAARSITLGTGTFTVTGQAGSWTTVGGTLTLSAASANIVFTATPNNQRALNIAGGQTYGSVTVNNDGNVYARFTFVVIGGAGAATINTVTINPRNNVFFNNDYTIATALNANGTAYNNAIGFTAADGATRNITVNGTASISWATIGGYHFLGTGAGFTASNAIDLGGNSGFTITGPASGGGGGRIIGG